MRLQREKERRASGSLPSERARRKKSGVARQFQRMGHWVARDHPEYEFEGEHVDAAYTSPGPDSARTDSARSSDGMRKASKKHSLSGERHGSRLYDRRGSEETYAM